MATQIDRLGGAKGSLAYKAPARVATTANITLSGLQTIDGVALAENERVLVKDQTTASQNGIYLAKVALWVRTKDFNGNSDVVRGTRLDVTDGSVGRGEYKVDNATSPVEIGTDDIVFVEETPVSGPESAVDGNLTSFSGTGGSLLQDSGIAQTSILSSANIDSTGTNGVQGYITASTNILIASDIGSTSSGNPVQGYVGSTASLLSTADAGSTSGSRAFEPSWGLDAYVGTSFNSTSGGSYTPNRDNGFIHTISNNAGEGTVTINAPSNYGLVMVEITNSTAPGVPAASTSYSLTSGAPSTEPDAIQIAKCWRLPGSNLLEWYTT